MSRNRRKIYGRCKLCGAENVKLSFEHVPPESTFNSQAVQLVKREDSLKCVTDPERKIWDMSGLPYTTQQRGDGDYHLCEQCNNNTRAWYVNQYRDFIYGMASAFSNHRVVHGDTIKIEAKDFSPLAIFKEIMVMFCDLNSGLSNDVELRNFLLNKTSTAFNSTKYRVFMFAFAGGLLRRSAASALLNISTRNILIQSEIISPPLGFVLYIDPPDNFSSQDCEITSFSSYEYEKKVSAEIILKAKGCYSVLPCDYRPQEDNHGSLEI